MLRALANAFKIEDLRKKIIFTLALIAVYRIGAFIPIPGIDGQALKQLMDRIAQSQAGAMFGLIDLFTGGAMRRMSIFTLGIMPYISAAIIFQLLVAVVPSLEKLAKEGEEGRRKINQYTRVSTVFLCIVQSLMLSRGLENPELFGIQVVMFPGWPFRLMAMLTLTTSTIFIMWLGERIQAKGIGNGISLIITAGIVSRLPAAAGELIRLLNIGQVKHFTLLPLSIVLVAVIVGVVVITQGQRRIPVQYARRVVGRKVYGGQNTYIPLRVNQAGVIPIIFASSILMFPGVIGGVVPQLEVLSRWLNPQHIVYTILYVGLIIFFCYFYTAITFNPIDISENMKRFGGFVPGIRPGKATGEFLDFVMTRVTLAGAIFLSIIAIFPQLVASWFKIPYLVASFFGGTGLLIIVGVMLDTMKQIESQLVMRHYEGFMKGTKLRGRR